MSNTTLQPKLACSNEEMVEELESGKLTEEGGDENDDDDL